MNIEIATFGNGCFWCTEAIFQTLNGVIAVTPGYMGGHITNPTYIEISNGDTGHAEVINIEFDADAIGFEDLLLIFFKTHNPTTLNRQGHDVGTQYRSVIFYHSDEQRNQAIQMIERLTTAKVFNNLIVTNVMPAAQFYKADAHHQNYYQNNIIKPYCVNVIHPKMVKFVNEFVDKINPKYLH